jgi:hypothetical protein
MVKKIERFEKRGLQARLVSSGKWCHSVEMAVTGITRDCSEVQRHYSPQRVPDNRSQMGSYTPITSDTPLRAFHVLGLHQYPRIEDRGQ